MGMLAALHVRVRKGNGSIQSRDLDIACTSKVPPDLMLHRWAFLAELDSPPLVNPPKITWISPKGSWC